jgi:sporulation protein YlmC with PRC-barrel domain
MLIELGTPVRCLDGPAGEVADVVIDPIPRRLTHLVIQPHRNHELARLVPIEVAHAENGQIALSCTTEDVHRMERVQEFAYIRFGEPLLQDPDWDVGIENVLAMPYYDSYGLEPLADPRVAVTYDRVPKGEVEIRRASEVLSSDYHRLGRIDGFVVDLDDHITHLVLERGHLWGRREVTIPIGAVERIRNDSVHIRLSKDDVGAMPAVPVRRWHAAQSLPESRDVGERIMRRTESGGFERDGKEVGER